VVLGLNLFQAVLYLIPFLAAYSESFILSVWYGSPQTFHKSPHNYTTSSNTIAGLLPDVIKIDRELITDIDSEPLKRALVGGLIQAVRSEGIEVVAEGVETVAELSCVIDLGATLIQGFIFAKPAAQPDREVHWPVL